MSINLSDEQLAFLLSASAPGEPDEVARKAWREAYNASNPAKEPTAEDRARAVAEAEKEARADVGLHFPVVTRIEKRFPWSKPKVVHEEVPHWFIEGFIKESVNLKLSMRDESGERRSKAYAAWLQDDWPMIWARARVAKMRAMEAGRK